MMDGIIISEGAFAPSEPFGLLAASGGLEYDYRSCKRDNRCCQVYQIF